MPAWNDYKQAARDRGSLAFELFVVVSTPDAPPEKLQAVLPAHLEYQRAREAAGDLFLAGPLSDETGEQMQGTGMIVYRAKDMGAARALADADPMHAEGIRTYTLRKWMVNEGMLTVSLGLSAQSVSLG
ncbi:MAG: YciI family protein [Pseudomonadota bacterium]